MVLSDRVIVVRNDYLPRSALTKLRCLGGSRQTGRVLSSHIGPHQLQQQGLLLTKFLNEEIAFLADDVKFESQLLIDPLQLLVLKLNLLGQIKRLLNFHLDRPVLLLRQFLVLLHLDVRLLQDLADAPVHHKQNLVATLLQHLLGDVIEILYLAHQVHVDRVGVWGVGHAAQVAYVHVEFLQDSPELALDCQPALTVLQQLSFGCFTLVDLGLEQGLEVSDDRTLLRTGSEGDVARQRFGEGKLRVLHLIKLFSGIYPKSIFNSSKCPITIHLIRITNYNPTNSISTRSFKSINPPIPNPTCQQNSTNPTKSTCHYDPYPYACPPFCGSQAAIVYDGRVMKTEMEDSNYESMISKLAKGSMEEKSASLKKLLFLYENARSRIYLYERRITECLELSLLIEERDISLNALNLLEKIIANTSAESDIMNIIKKRLLSKMVLNLGSVEVTIRKISHKCILEFLRKFHDSETVISVYLKTAMQQTENSHLRLKALNSLHSLLMSETKYFNHDMDAARALLEELIHSSYQKEYVDVSRAAIICLIFILKVKGAENSIKAMNGNTESELLQLRYENEQLSALLDSILHTNRSDNILQEEAAELQNNTPSPKFISIQQTSELKQPKTESPSDQLDRIDKIPEMQLKIYNEVSYAEQFLKRLQKTANWEFNQIEEFAPFLEKCLVDESIKLFSISKKIVEVIFNSEDGKKKEYYVVLVPCIVGGIGNKRFIVKKNLIKLVRQYIKNHTDVWVKHFVQKFAVTKNGKVKDILIDLLMHAYRSSPEFYHPTQRAFQVFDQQISDDSSLIKRKVIDCVMLIVERQGKDEKLREEMLQVFSPDPYNKIIRKMGKTHNSLTELSDQCESQTLEPLSPIAVKKERKTRLVTAQPQKLSHLQKSEQMENKLNISEQKYKNRQLIQYSRGRARNSQIEINFKIKKQERKSKDSTEKTSLERLPELKKTKNSSNSKYEANESPVKRSIGERNIVYIERQNLKPLDNPRAELDKALADIKDNNWSVQFDSINKLRAIVEFHKDLISDETMAFIVNELLSCLNNLRSGVTKLAFMCLNEIMRKFHKRTYPFTETIIMTIIKKSITTSEFMQDEIKKCIATSVEQLCLAKMITGLNSARESKSNDIKMTFLLFVEGMIRIERIYRKESGWIWGVLTDFNEEPQFNLRSECKRMVKIIMETYKDWKTDVIDLPKESLERIDKLLKNLSQKGENNLWIQIQNHEFEKIMLSKIMTSKYFANNYNKFEELDRNYTLKKNWKDRIKLLNNIFQMAFDHPAEFEANTHIRKYFNIAIEQIDDKNPGLLINALNNLQKSIEYFPLIVEECLAPILDKTVAVFETRRGQLMAVASKMLNRLYSHFDLNKIIKEYLKLLVGNNKPKVEIINQLITLLRENEQKEAEARSIREIPLQRNSLKVADTLDITNSCKNMCVERGTEGAYNSRLKELITVCQRRFGEEFSVKLLANAKVVELMS